MNPFDLQDVAYLCLERATFREFITPTRTRAKVDDGEETLLRLVVEGTMLGERGQNGSAIADHRVE